jgi:hypothetical protein
MSTKPQIISPTDFDYRVLSEDDRGFIKARADGIREATKRTAESIRLIGQWLTEAKERLMHGQWESWLKTEFGWSDFTAKAFMRVYRAFKSENFSDMQIDVSALYLITAKKTPEPVRQEVFRRAQAGEPMTRQKAQEVWNSYQARHEPPSPAVARQIAIATGKATPSSEGIMVLPMSAAAEEVLTIEFNKIRTLYNAIQLIAEQEVTPGQMLILGKKHGCLSLISAATDAMGWLNDLIEEADR